MLCSPIKEAIALYGANTSHIVTMMLLSWPYESIDQSSDTVHELTYATLALKYIGDEISHTNHILKSEVDILKKQFASIFCYYCSSQSL